MFFFQILYSSLITLSSTASSKPENKRRRDVQFGCNSVSQRLAQAPCLHLSTQWMGQNGPGRQVAETVILKLTCWAQDSRSFSRWLADLTSFKTDVETFDLQTILQINNELPTFDQSRHFRLALCDKKCSKKVISHKIYALERNSVISSTNRRLCLPYLACWKLNLRLFFWLKNAFSDTKSLCSQYACVKLAAKTGARWEKQKFFWSQFYLNKNELSRKG